MNTQKVAITMPKELVAMIDVISKQKGLSRSKFISTILLEKVLQDRNREIQGAYNRVFSDESIRKEQIQTAMLFEGLETKEGQEW